LERAREAVSDAQTFLFADIAGYTALTEAHGDETAADIADGFCRAVADAAGDEGELIKSVGDAVMLRFDDPGTAVRLGLRVPHEVWTGHGLPAAAVGIHHGAAVERGGDWFGSAVNVAARLTALARGGEVLVSDAVRQAAGAVPGVRFQDQGEKSLRNVSTPVAAYIAELADHPSLPDQVDPVCRMMVAAGREACTCQHGESEFRFCSQECADRFARDPESHLQHLR
jgi:adenylate cyclase